MSREDMILLGTVIGAFVIGYAIVSWIVSIIKTPRYYSPDEPPKPHKEDDLPLLDDPSRDRRE